MSSNNSLQGAKNLKALLQRGDQKTIAERLNLSKQTVSDALNEGRPGHPVVIEALRMARESGALAAAQDLATLTAV
jgi:DNA-binding transcriptional regulator LsrR (DeoR family)